jgi:hypothetical protein
MKINVKFALLLAILSGCFLFTAKKEEPCSEYVRSKQFWVRHTEPKGVGYRDGYTTLEGFFMTAKEHFGFYPYLDLRAHIFNSGRYAANIGAGGRALTGSRIWGANAYYDVRGTKRITFNQLSLGFEAMGEMFDFLANGYLVIGRKNSSSFNVGFDHFENHYLFLRRDVDSAMSGVDANFRFHCLRRAKWDAYFEIGPYYYHGSFGQNLIGGKAKFAAILADRFFGEGTVSYDHVFKWIGQGIFGFRFPLGEKTKFERRPCPSPAISERLMQIPDHNEIVVVKKNTRISEAIDPRTGDPLFFWFVDNRGNSLGTFESRFPMLAQAQAASNPYHYIYVFQGDGTTMGMDSGIVLKDFQQLLGSGVVHDVATTHGIVAIPPFSSGYPVMSNAMGVGVTLAHGNTVSGMHIDGSLLEGILGVGVANAQITRNIITDANKMAASDLPGVHLLGPGMSGAYVVSNNLISGTTPRMIGVFIAPKGDDVCGVTLWSNQISVPKDGVELKPGFMSPGSTALVSASISGNVFEVTTNEKSFFLEPHNSARISYTIQSNTFRASNNTIGTGLSIIGRDSSFSSGVVSNNQFIDLESGFRFESGGSVQMAVDASNNLFSNNMTIDFEAKITDPMAFLCVGLQGNSAPTHGYIFDNTQVTSTLTITSLSGNTGSVTQMGAGPIVSDPNCPF